MHAARQVLQVDLVDDAEARRHDAEGVERLHAPLHELVALLVALEFQLHVQVQRILGAEIIDHDRVVNDQVHRHQRRRLLADAAHQHQACHGRNRHQPDTAQQVLAHHVHARNEDAQRRHAQQGADPIQFHVVARHFGQMAQAEHGQHADRQVYREDPRPRRHRQDGGPDGGAQHRHHGHRGGVDADAPAQHFQRREIAHPAAAHAHQRRRARALENARCGQLPQRAGQRAPQRSQGEQHQAEGEHAAKADALGQRRQRQQRHHHRQVVGVDDPDGFGGRGVQIDGKGGQGYVGDGGVQHRQADARHHRGRRPIPARGRQTVGRGGFGAAALGRVLCGVVLRHHDFLTGRCQPSTVSCLARDTVSLSAGASRVRVVPAPRVAPRPTRTGATSCVSEPMKASSSMMVRCLLTPS
ncbi:hypothetical protein G6F65_015351 [Rhizopus arrhizus]|nr:hypothetical protein G6F65_015351 [Rhizopus arrhizus]